MDNRTIIQQSIDYIEDNLQTEITAAKLADMAHVSLFHYCLLETDRFNEMLGGWGDIYLLTEGEKLVSFLTLTGQDAVRDESLTPWIGFVFTVPEYRGHRYAGKLLTYAETRAAKMGHKTVYIATDHIGLYEKYGYTYKENQVDIWGDDMRVLYKEL